MRRLVLIFLAGCAETSLLELRNEADPEELSLGRTKLVIAASRAWERIDQLATSDLDGDGLDDLVVERNGGIGVTSTISVLLARGSGFEESYAIQLPGYVSYRWVYDADGDEIDDLVLIGMSTGSLWRGLGDGTFAEPETFETIDAIPACGSVADVDGDGLRETMICDLVSSRPKLYVLLNRGGRYQRIDSGIELPLGQWGPVTTANIDADRYLDVVFKPDDLDAAYWARGNGDGTFQQPAMLFRFPGLRFLWPFPIDRDGDDDFLAVLANDDGLLLQNEGGTLEVGDRFDGALGIIAFDIDGDGTVELLDLAEGEIRIRSAIHGAVIQRITASRGTDAISGAWDWDGDGTRDLVEYAGPNHYYRKSGLDEPVLYQLDRGSRPLQIDGDAERDFITDNGVSIGVARGLDRGSVRSFDNGSVRTPRIELADLDADGRVDLIALTDGRVILRRGGEGTFGDPEILHDPATDFAVGDFDGDGTLETEHSLGLRLEAADVTGDGADDLIFIEPGRISVSSSELAASTEYEVDGSIAGLDDIDGDGRADLFLASRDRISWLLGSSTGFVPGDSVEADSPCCATSGDFDGDEKIDLAIADSRGLSIRYGSSRSIAAIPFTPRALHRRDFDGDGIQDLLVWSAWFEEPDGMPVFDRERQDYATLILGRRDRTLKPKTFLLRLQVLDVALADVDGDQLVDVVSSAIDTDPIPSLPPEITVYSSKR